MLSESTQCFVDGVGKQACVARQPTLESLLENTIFALADSHDDVSQRAVCAALAEDVRKSKIEIAALEIAEDDALMASFRHQSSVESLLRRVRQKSAAERGDIGLLIETLAAWSAPPELSDVADHLLLSLKKAVSSGSDQHSKASPSWESAEQWRQCLLAAKRAEHDRAVERHRRALKKLELLETRLRALDAIRATLPRFPTGV